MQVLNKKEPPFDEEDEKYLVALATQLARALALTTLRAADAAEPGLVLRGPFNRIVGRSEALREVYERVLARRADRRDRALPRRDRHGKGPLRARHPRELEAPERPVRHRRLHDAPRAARRERALRPRARRVHRRRSPRLGKVELAGGGTLFLDEIGDLPLDIQGKLLRFLQERAFERVGGRETLRADVRVVCATHRDLRALVAEGKFREDLFYRVRVVEIVLPPLRARGEAEVLALAEHFADMYAARYGRPSPTFSPDALAALLAHDLPGNVRELEHWIESAIVLAPDGVIRASAFPSAEGAPRVSHEPAVEIPLDLPLEEAERRFVRAVVHAAQGQQDGSREGARHRPQHARAFAEALSAGNFC